MPEFVAPLPLEACPRCPTPEVITQFNAEEQAHTQRLRYLVERIHELLAQCEKRAADDLGRISELAALDLRVEVVAYDSNQQQTVANQTIAYANQLDCGRRCKTCPRLAFILVAPKDIDV